MLLPIEGMGSTVQNGKVRLDATKQDPNIKQYYSPKYNLQLNYNSSLFRLKEVEYDTGNNTKETSIELTPRYIWDSTNIIDVNYISTTPNGNRKLVLDYIKSTLDSIRSNGTSIKVECTYPYALANNAVPNGVQLIFELKDKDNGQTNRAVLAAGMTRWHKILVTLFIAPTDYHNNNGTTTNLYEQFVRDFEELTSNIVVLPPKNTITPDDTEQGDTK